MTNLDNLCLSAKSQHVFSWGIYESRIGGIDVWQTNKRITTNAQLWQRELQVWLRGLHKSPKFEITNCRLAQRGARNVSSIWTEVIRKSSTIPKICSVSLFLFSFSFFFFLRGLLEAFRGKSSLSTLPWWLTSHHPAFLFLIIVFHVPS